MLRYYEWKPSRGSLVIDVLYGCTNLLVYQFFVFFVRLASASSPITSCDEQTRSFLVHRVFVMLAVYLTVYIFVYFNRCLFKV